MTAISIGQRNPKRTFDVSLIIGVGQGGHEMSLEIPESCHLPISDVPYIHMKIIIVGSESPNNSIELAHEMIICHSILASKSFISPRNRPDRHFE